MANRTLSETKALLKKDQIYEVNSAFLVNDFGKYRPNITFVIPKDIECDPTAYRSDKPTKLMLRGMNVNFDGETSVLFGDYWKSQKGAACFRPKPVTAANHVLIRCSWGGAFNSSRGIGSYAGKDVLYCRRAVSNGRGVGNDYLVVPIGFYRILHDEEMDGTGPSAPPNFEERAGVVRKTFAEFDQEQSDRADAEARAKAEAEVASRVAKLAGLGERIEAVNCRREDIGQSPYNVGETGFGFTSTYSHNVRLYTEANVVAAEREIAQLEEKPLSRWQSRSFSEASSDS